MHYSEPFIFLMMVFTYPKYVCYHLASLSYGLYLLLSHTEGIVLLHVSLYGSLGTALASHMPPPTYS